MGVHQDWSKEEYPMVPGHEIAGRVVQVGKAVTKFKFGDYAGVGCMVNSCGACESCKRDQEQYCRGVVMTYHGHDQFQALLEFRWNAATGRGRRNGSKWRS